MTCPACGTENRPEARFCLNCGAGLARACPNGHAVPAGARFCDECGASIETAPAPAAAPVRPAAERKLVSVLFADLVGFTSSSEGRDAEDTRVLLSRYPEKPSSPRRARSLAGLEATPWLERFDAARPALARIGAEAT